MLQDYLANILERSNHSPIIPQIAMLSIDKNVIAAIELPHEVETDNEQRDDLL